MYNNADSVQERHRHRYEVNPDYVDRVHEGGLNLVGRDEAGERMEGLPEVDVVAPCVREGGPELRVRERSREREQPPDDPDEEDLLWGERRSKA